ncbi:DUF1828 domain-containing protein [Frankia sp. AiPs1]|uniref:DUF1828 domain-containing protein n=1 Tax=Frankia sp. AiPa1 TaxID=573492 RepID=UPI00202B8473|nr:DUF1828 domain-containing protein [Frankia sp. AiPa1]MCL9759294.1 DUF1828 domain-containing protein [Frankia sp. AiPa1]
MDGKEAVGAILRTINDYTAVRPYGDGLLVDLPLTYGDGDAVRILVEPMGNGYRVTDRATAATLLSMAGVNVSKGRPAEAFAEALRAADLNSFNAIEGELATFGDASNLGRLVLDVAQASIRVDQLRWLAARQPLARFPERLTQRVQDWVRGNREVQQKAPVPQKSGRNRSVTLKVSNDGQSAYIQAVGIGDRDQAAEHCYYIFDLSKVPKENRIAALDGNRDDWPTPIIEELKGVSSVEFFGNPFDLERRLDSVVPPPSSMPSI